MAVTLPKLSARAPIVGEGSRSFPASTQFLQFMNATRDAIIAADAAQDQVIADLAQVVSDLAQAVIDIQTAQATADAAQTAADAAATDAATALTAANNANSRIDDVLDGTEPFTGLAIDGAEDVKDFLAKVASDELPTAGLAAESVTQAERDFTATAQTLTGTTFKTIAEKEVTVTGGRLDIVASFSINTENTTIYGLRFRVVRETGGIDIATPYDLVLGGNVTKDAGGDYLFIQPVAIFCDDDPAAGTHTYRLEVWLSRDDCSVEEVTNAYLRVEEVKR